MDRIGDRMASTRHCHAQMACWLHESILPRPKLLMCTHFSASPQDVPLEEPVPRSWLDEGTYEAIESTRRLAVTMASPSSIDHAKSASYGRLPRPIHTVVIDNC